jgi:hypothetical protein
MHSWVRGESVDPETRHDSHEKTYDSRGQEGDTGSGPRDSPSPPHLTGTYVTANGRNKRTSQTKSEPYEHQLEPTA